MWGLRSWARSCVRCGRMRPCQPPPFRRVDLDADISHVCFLFLRLYKLVCRCPSACGHSRTGQTRVFRGVQPRWLIGVFLALASAVREENALMSLWLFVPQKPAAVSAVMSVVVCRLFLFANNIGFSLSVGRPKVRPTCLRIAAFTFAASPADLMRSKKALNR